MLILLPPSEGKTAPRRGKPLDLGALTAPALTGAREQVLSALEAVCGGEVEAARQVLGLSSGQVEEIGRNTRLRHAPTATAGQVYTGVLYEALDLATLAVPARRLLRKSLLVFSGLWGVVGIEDRIPAYRCAVGVSLPGVGGLGSFWRKQLTQLDVDQLVVDLRSGPYAAMWAPTGPHATVRVLHERMVGGSLTRTVVSHFNKATKGRLVRELAMAGAAPRNAGELATVLRDLKYTVEVDASRLDVIVAEL